VFLKEIFWDWVKFRRKRKERIFHSKAFFLGFPSSFKGSQFFSWKGQGSWVKLKRGRISLVLIGELFLRKGLVSN